MAQIDRLYDLQEGGYITQVIALLVAFNVIYVEQGGAVREVIAIML